MKWFFYFSVFPHLLFLLRSYEARRGGSFNWQIARSTMRRDLKKKISSFTETTAISVVDRELSKSLRWNENFEEPVVNRKFGKIYSEVKVMEESTINYNILPPVAILTVLAHLANTVHHMVSFFSILAVLKTLLKTYTLVFIFISTFEPPCISFSFYFPCFAYICACDLFFPASYLSTEAFT